jgi:hypothetical protein
VLVVYRSDALSIALGTRATLSGVAKYWFRKDSIFAVPLPPGSTGRPWAVTLHTADFHARPPEPVVPVGSNRISSQIAMTSSVFKTGVGTTGAAGARMLFDMVDTATYVLHTVLGTHSALTLPPNRVALSPTTGFAVEVA